MATIQELSEKVDQLQVSLDAEQAQIAKVITDLEAVVADLQAQLEGSVTSQEIQAVADKLDLAIADLKGTIADPTEPPVEG